MANKTSQHIINSSTNLLGFCLIVITSLRITNKSESTLLDEFTSIIALLLTVSTLFSFISIKTKNNKKELLFEKIADYFFVFALIGLFFIILFIALDVIK